MGELERNMRDDVGQSQGNAPSTDSGGQMDMFEDERERASLHRRGAIARGVAKRGLVAFLAFAMAFGTTPAQLWAEGAEGIAEAVAQAAPLAENGSGESATSPAADLNASGMVANGGTAEQDATATASGPTDKTEDDSAAGNEAPAASTSDASKQDTAVVSAAGEAKAQPAKAESQEVSATCSVVGTDAKGAQQTWAAAQRITLKEGSTAADLSEQLFKQAGLTTDYDPNGTWGWALNTITSPFGWRYHPIYHTQKYHSGVDIGASYGATIVAADGGTIITAGTVSGYGNCVVINHGNGITTLYGHMSSIAVRVGQKVSKGQTIGYVGSTGNSTGPHLHWEVTVNGVRQNPLNYAT